MLEVLSLSQHRRSVHKSSKLKEIVSKRLSLEMPLVRKHKSTKSKIILDGSHGGSSRKNKFITRTKEQVANYGLELCVEGVGGTYFVKDGKSKYCAVFKPIDEEPGACNNPKKLLQTPLLPPGGGAMREVAAYLLDKNFASVPETCLVDGIIDSRLNYPSGIVFSKSGSIQKYIENVGDASSMGCSRFPVEDIHRIGTLDIRLFNLDRSAENLLVQKKSNGQVHLVPIDHSYILPDRLTNAWFDWLHWPQSKVAFSKETLAYIARLNLEEDVKVLQKLGFTEQNMTNLEITTLFLKSAAVSGWNLYEIGKCISSNKPMEPATLEKLVNESKSCDGKFRIEEYKKVLENFFNGHTNEK